MIDVEAITSEELSELISALEEKGFVNKRKVDYKKNSIIQAMQKRGAKNPFISQDVSRPIHELADFMLHNYDIVNGRQKKRTELPKDPSERKQYVDLVDGIVELIYPFYNNNIGFREIEKTGGV